MAAVLSFKGDPLWKRAEDPGYRVGWRSRTEFAKGHIDGEMTYGEAQKKAQELAAKDAAKTYFPELIVTEQ